MAPCKSGVRDLLLLAEDMNMRQKWVDRLNKNVKVLKAWVLDQARILFIFFRHLMVPRNQITKNQRISDYWPTDYQTTDYRRL